MAIQIPQATRQAAADAVVDLVDGGAGAGTLVIYTGTQPDPDIAATGTLLATLTFSDPAFGAADTDGIATANSITADSSADATGTAGYFRVLDSDSNVVYSGTVGTSGEDLNLNTVSIVAGAQVSVTSLTFQAPQNQS